ncbi:hypothetical protein [Breoghania sp.]|uniref:hypothetical protein n=1 Tax=Breoghania sp. TaxID=2065378 RepID=UPI00262685B3|nr:hypothetical protein [Breoghania sp.]MDJ0933161.1 hypothetical protein [Breoghania sp.]
MQYGRPAQWCNGTDPFDLEESSAGMFAAENMLGLTLSPGGGAIRTNGNNNVSRLRG